MKRLTIKFYDTILRNFKWKYPIILNKPRCYLNRYYVAFMIVRVTNKANSVFSKRNVSVSAGRLSSELGQLTEIKDSGLKSLLAEE